MVGQSVGLMQPWDTQLYHTPHVKCDLFVTLWLQWGIMPWVSIGWVWTLLYEKNLIWFWSVHFWCHRSAMLNMWSGVLRYWADAHQMVKFHAFFFSLPKTINNCHCNLILGQNKWMFKIIWPMLKVPWTFHFIYFQQLSLFSTFQLQVILWLAVSSVGMMKKVRVMFTEQRAKIHRWVQSLLTPKYCQIFNYLVSTHHCIVTESDYWVFNKAKPQKSKPQRIKEKLYSAFQSLVITLILKWPILTLWPFLPLLQISSQEFQKDSCCMV